MAFKYLNNIPLEEAKQKFIEFLSENGYTERTEEIATVESAERITSEPVYANICAPHYPASAMDGIALRAEITFGASDTAPVKLAKDQFVVVDTGDPLPDNCDAVVMIEDVIYQDDGTVLLYKSATPWQHIRQVGEDVCAGEMILGAYNVITPSTVGALLAGGVLKVNVIAKPRIAIIPTGDEIVPPTDNPQPGQIIEFNSSIFSAMVRRWDAIPNTEDIVPDKYDKILSAVKNAAENNDIVLLNAGSSAGRDDYSTDVLSEAGEVLCHGIAIKPGKPTILARIDNKPVIGVPGYPVSGILVLEKLLKPVIDMWYHRECPETEEVEAVLSRPVLSGLKYEEFVRVRLGKNGDKLTATPLSRGSGMVTSFMKADGIMTVPQGVEGYEAGNKVEISLLKSSKILEHTLLAIGSHDPLLDEIADLLHRKYPYLTLSSSHVGSMGGIMAVKKEETHIAGVHLLNEADGSYNVEFIKKYFPKGGVRLVECVGRSQGLMVAAGNPLAIDGIESLRKKGIRYVNRQKGSGTRILIDYLCHKNDIDTNQIYGYDREEFTHTSVAAQIASGTADAGMGIYSAAKLYNLDFIHVCIEQYDLLISDSAWDNPDVQKIIEILKSDVFKSRLTAMGGYVIDNPGTVRFRF